MREKYGTRRKKSITDPGMSFDASTETANETKQKQQNNEKKKEKKRKERKETKFVERYEIDVHDDENRRIKIENEI